MPVEAHTRCRTVQQSWRENYSALTILILKIATLQLLVVTQQVALHLEAGPLLLVDLEVEPEDEAEVEAEANLD